MRYYMLNKPQGCVTACSDERHKTVMECFPQKEREGLFPIGRLDKDTVGLLIVTDDGNLAFKIANPASRVKKTYCFWAKGSFDEQKLERLRAGVTISTKRGDIVASGEVECLAEGKLRARLMNTGLGDVPVVKLRVTITEGKKHQVKKMALAVGLRVVYLERLKIAGLSLDESLPRGEFRPLTEEEIRALRGE